MVVCQKSVHSFCVHAVWSLPKCAHFERSVISIFQCRKFVILFFLTKVLFTSLVTFLHKTFVRNTNSAYLLGGPALRIKFEAIWHKNECKKILNPAFQKLSIKLFRLLNFRKLMGIPVSFKMFCIFSSNACWSLRSWPIENPVGSSDSDFSWSDFLSSWATSPFSFGILEF